MTVAEMVEKYYPRLWDSDRLEILVAAGRLDQEDADRIMRKEPLKT